MKLFPLSLLLTLAIFSSTAAAMDYSSHTSGSQSAMTQQQQHHRLRRSLSVGYLRTQSVDTTGLTCQLDTPRNDSSPATSYEIPFYYALGTRGNMGYVDLFILQQRLFASISNSITWCWQDTQQTSVSSSSQSPPVGTRQKDRELQSKKRERVVAMARELGIISVSAGPSKMEGSCPNSTEIEALLSETNSTECEVVMGSIRVLAQKVDNLNYMTAAARDELEAEINSQKVWSSWTDLPELGFLLYLGDTQAQVFPHYTVSPILLTSDSPSMAPSTQAFGGVIPAAVVAPVAQSSSNTNIPLIVGVGVPIAAALFIVALITGNKKRKRNIVTAASSGNLAAVPSGLSATQFHEMMNSDFVLVGAADPPGSFHEGLYHYLRDGTRYLSTRCEGCLETRRNSFYTDNNLGTILEDEEYEENILITSDSKNLGRRATTHDVHRCASATCARCLTERSDTLFVPAFKRGRRRSSGSDGESSSSAYSSRPGSTENGDQSYYQTPEHVEV